MLKISKVAFPGLGIGEFDVDSVAFSLGSIDIAWYAILITCGMILAVLYCMYRCKKCGITPDDVLDIALVAIPVGIVGARLYYILTKLEDFPTFYSWINIRSGGLAIYGGLIGGALAVILVCFIKKIRFFAFADCAFPGIILAQGIGRWGNFANGEAFGYETDWFCRMQLCNNLTGYVSTNVHPTFLYESLWNVIGFAIAHFLFPHKKYDGEISLFVCGWYGFGRFFIEGLRTDSLYTTLFGVTFRTSQVLAAVIFVTCVVIFAVLRVKKYNPPLYYRNKK